jgi:hypothetical protein
LSAIERRQPVCSPEDHRVHIRKRRPAGRDGDDRTGARDAYNRAWPRPRLNSRPGARTSLTAHPALKQRASENAGTVSVSADGDGLLAAYPDDAFEQLLRENGAAALAVARVLARLTVSLTDRLFETAALEVRFRIQSELLRLAKGREQTPAGIDPAPTHQKIAAAVGAHREAVTKEFRELTAENILRQKGRQLVILDIQRLRQHLQKYAGLTASLVVDW